MSAEGDWLSVHPGTCAGPPSLSERGWGSLTEQDINCPGTGMYSQVGGSLSEQAL